MVAIARPNKNSHGAVLNFLSKYLPSNPKTTRGMAVANPICPIRLKENTRLFFIFTDFD